MPIALSDNTIESLSPRPWKDTDIKIPVPEEVIADLKGKITPQEAATLAKEMIVTVKPTWNIGNNHLIKVQDLMVLHILMANQWRKPLYFAVTVGDENKLNMDPFLRMDGLAFRVLPYKTNQVDSNILAENLLQKYQYRNLNNKKVFYNVSTIKLMQNYRSAFQQLVQNYLLDGDTLSARKTLHFLEDRIPEDVIPYSSELGVAIAADLYERSGLDPMIDLRVQHLLPGRYENPDQRLRTAGYYAQILNDYDRAESILREIIRGNPDNVKAYSWLSYIFTESGQYQKGIALLEEWLSNHPGDPNALKELNRIRALVAKDTSRSN